MGDISIIKIFKIVLGGAFLFLWAMVGWKNEIFNQHNPLTIQPIYADEGDTYISRAPTTSLISNNSLGTEQVLTYDTEVQTSNDITRQAGNQAFRIQNDGRYLIIVNTRWNYVDIGNNNRHVVRTLIKVGGTAVPSVYGMASGYGRDSGSADEDGTVTMAYIDHTVLGTSADDIGVYVQNFGDTTVALADQFSDQSGIQIIRLPDSAEYLKVKNTTGFTYTGTLGFALTDPTWTQFGWTTQDAETNTAVLEWVSGNDITLKSAGHYLVIYAIRGDTTGGRKGAGYRLTLNDVEIPASSVHSYMRGSDGALESWVQWGGIINASSNDVLNIDAGGTGEVAGGTMTEAAMTVVKMPDVASYVRVRYDSSRAGETTGAYPFNQEDEDDAGVHDNATNNSRISGTADSYDWLLMGSWWLRNTTTPDNTRTTEHFRWFRTGTEVQYGSGLSYTRGDQSTTGVPAGGRNSAIVATSLGTSEYMEMNLRQESGTGDRNRDFVGNKIGITGVALNTLVPTFTQNSYRWYVDNDSTDPIEVWGTPDLAENTAIVLIPASNDPPNSTQELRLRVNFTVNNTNLEASNQIFKLQYKAGTDGSCTSGTWTDVGAGNTWEYASSTVTDGADITGSLSTTNVSEEYAKSAPTQVNHNSATVGQDIEYDFHIVGTNISDATQYSFRVIKNNGTIFDAYTNCPTLTTEPATNRLMRHGNLFINETEQGFFWAD